MRTSHLRGGGTADPRSPHPERGHLPPAAVARAQARRPPAPHTRAVREVEASAPRHGSTEVPPVARAVELRRRPRLLAEQRVDAPAASQPEAEAGQGADDFVE